MASSSSTCARTLRASSHLVVSAWAHCTTSSVSNGFFRMSSDSRGPSRARRSLHEWSEYAEQITIWRSGSTCQSRSMVSRPSQPGGMRMSTNASAKWRCEATEATTWSSASRPWYAETSSKVTIGSAVAAGRSSSAASSASSVPADASGGAKILRKSSWIAWLSSTTRMRWLVADVMISRSPRPAARVKVARRRGPSDSRPEQRRRARAQRWRSRGGRSRDRPAWS